METSNIIITLITILAFAVPIWLTGRAGKKQKKGLAAKFDQLLAQHQFQPTEKEQWDNTVLSIDEGAKKLLWMREKGGAEDEHWLIDLKNFAACKKVNLSRTVVIDKQNTQMLDQLRLDLLPKDAQAAPVLLEFFLASQIYQLNKQMELQDKWHQRISAVLYK